MKTPQEGTVIHGTLRAADLLPAFLDELAIWDPAGYQQVTFGPFSYIPSDASLSDSDDWWDTEEAQEKVIEIMDALDACAPEGMYFGAHPGDMSDFGFWSCNEYHEGEEE